MIYLKEKQVTRYMTEGYECDQCNTRKNKENLPEGWIEVEKKHEIYGTNNSCECLRKKRLHICSSSCFIALVKECVENISEHEDEDIKLNDTSLSFWKDVLKIHDSNNTQVASLEECSALFKEYTQYTLKKSLLYARLRDNGLSDIQIGKTVCTILNTCKHCWDGNNNCRCWDES